MPQNSRVMCPCTDNCAFSLDMRVEADRDFYDDMAADRRRLDPQWVDPQTVLNEVTNRIEELSLQYDNQSDYSRNTGNEMRATGIILQPQNLRNWVGSVINNWTITPEPATVAVAQNTLETLFNESEEIMTDTHYAAEHARKLVNWYITNKVGTYNGADLIDSDSSTDTAKLARKLYRAFKRYVIALPLADKVAFESQVEVKQDARGTFSFTRIPGYGFSNAPYFESLYKSRLSIRQATKVLESVLPSWVTITPPSRNRNVTVNGVRTDNAYFTLSTNKGAAHAQALRDTIGIYTFYTRWTGSTGYVPAVDIAYDIKRMLKLKTQGARMIYNAGRAERMKPSQPKNPVRSGGGDLDAFLSKLTAQRATSEYIVERFDMKPHGLLSSRNWGIEVETGGARGVERPAGWDARHDGSLRSAYGSGDAPEECEDDHNETRYNWSSGVYETNTNYVGRSREECDTCIEYDEWYNRDDDEDCKEFVSPILHSWHSKGLEQLMAELSEQPQNDSSGIHVHVDAADLTPKQIGSLVYGYRILEPLLEASYQREEREYCKLRSTRELKQILSQSKKAHDHTEIPRGDRYVTLNLQALDDHGTVEFRALSTVTDYQYVIRWAYVVREIVNVAVAGMTQSEWNRIDSFEKLHALFVAKGRETVDTSMSNITPEDITDMLTKNGGGSYYSNVQQATLELVGGEL